MCPALKSTKGRIVQVSYYTVYPLLDENRQTRTFLFEKKNDLVCCIYIMVSFFNPYITATIVGLLDHSCKTTMLSHVSRCQHSTAPNCYLITYFLINQIQYIPLWKGKALYCCFFAHLMAIDRLGHGQPPFSPLKRWSLSKRWVLRILGTLSSWRDLRIGSPIWRIKKGVPFGLFFPTSLRSEAGWKNACFF